jgi:hypothetical protein
VPMKLDKETFKLQDTSGFRNLALMVGSVGLIGCFIGFRTGRDQFFHSYLTAYIFWVSIGLGALFFILLHHLVDATWSVILRRLAESVMVTLPIMVVFFLPVLFGLHDLYHWSHADAVAEDVLLQKKSPFLNQNFFIIRAAVYFTIWYLLGRNLYKTSLLQDKAPSQNIIERMRAVSGPGMLLFALSITFAAFDWLMSLDPHWYSTIFGVYFFAGCLLSILAFITLIVVFLRRNGILHEEITVEHFHDLGKLMFAFTVFWAYIAFSQYFLIWYGNIPEETVWYLHRWEGNWKCLSLIIVFGHFVIPFGVLLSRVPKRNVTVMAIMSIWILAIHWVDLYWLVLPNLHKHHFHFSWMDLVTFLGVGGIFLFFFWKRFSSQPIIPVKDPKLQASINFVNI